MGGWVSIWGLGSWLVLVGVVSEGSIWVGWRVGGSGGIESGWVGGIESGWVGGIESERVEERKESKRRKEDSK